MGQRHQIYFVKKEKNQYHAMGAYHLQWRYGMSAIVDATRVASTIERAKTSDGKWENFVCRDSREIDSVIVARYGVSLKNHVSMVHDESETLIEGGKIFPERGDNNDGCALFVLDEDLKEVRLCFFTPEHVEGKHGKKCKKNVAYSREEYLAFYYNETEQKDPEFLKNFALEIEFLSQNKVKKIDQKELDLILKKGAA